MFLCRQSYFQEGFNCGFTKEGMHDTDVLTSDLHWTVEQLYPREQGDTSRIIGNYSTRILSFEEDALNACLGLLEALKTTHYWGVQIMEQDDNGTFGMDLAWINEDTSGEERKGFPSWSWTRWKGTKTLSGFYPDETMRSIEIQANDTQWVDVLQDGTLQGNLGEMSSGQILKITGTIYHPSFENIQGKPYTILTTTSGLDLRVETLLDSRDYAGMLHDAIALEFREFYSSYYENENTLTGIVLLLKPHNAHYRRIGVAGCIDGSSDAIGLIGDIQLGSGPVPMANGTISTIYLE